MINYISEDQLSIEEFKTPFQTSLSEDIRWVELSKIVPWDNFAKAYISVMNQGFGGSWNFTSHCSGRFNHQAYGEVG